MMETMDNRIIRMSWIKTSNTYGTDEESKLTTQIKVIEPNVSDSTLKVYLKYLLSKRNEWTKSGLTDAEYKVIAEKYIKSYKTYSMMLLAGGVLLAGGLGFGGYYYWKKNRNN